MYVGKYENIPGMFQYFMNLCCSMGWLLELKLSKLNGYTFDGCSIKINDWKTKSHHRQLMSIEHAEGINLHVHLPFDTPPIASNVR